jgi:hypothetical protein
VNLDDQLDDLRGRLLTLSLDVASLGYQLDDMAHPPEDAPEPTVRRSPERPPRMTCWPWQKDQGIEIGATGRRAWYWRISLGRGHGSMWAGPYYYPDECKQAGLRADYQQWRQRKIEAEAAA